MARNSEYCGVYAVTVTPFSDDGLRLNEEGVRSVVRTMTSQGITRIVACGNTGEYSTLSSRERERVVDLHAEACEGDVQLVVGIGGAVQDARRAAEHAMAAGASAVMIHPPSGPHVTPSGLIAYWQQVAELGVPMIPYLRGNAVDDDVIRGMLDVESLVAVKYARNDPLGFAAAVRIGGRRPEVHWICGLAESWAPFFWIAGACGFTSGLANITPKPSLALYAALQVDDHANAMAIWARIRDFELLRSRADDGYNVAAVKEAMRQQGREVGPVRAPASLVGADDRKIIGHFIEEWTPAS